MKIVVTNQQNLTLNQKQRLESLGDVTYYDSLPDGREYLRRVQGADIVCSGTAGLQDVYEQLSNVYITVGFVSVAFVDLNVMRQNGVSISNAPGINRHAVSEWLTWMLLELARDFSSFANSGVAYRKDGDLPPYNPGLTTKNITILGNGNISRQLQRIVNALDMNLTVFKRGDDLHRLVADADYVVDTLHHNDSTEGLLDAAFFAAMKQGANFVSITRSEIMDVDALVDALDSGHLSRAAMDCASVLVGDTADDYYTRLKNHPKVIATPHIAYNSTHSIIMGNDVMIDNVEAWIAGKPQNVLNPAVEEK